MLSGKGLMTSVQVCVVFGLTVLKVLGKFSLTTSIVALENTANPVQSTGAAGTVQEEGDEVRERAMEQKTMKKGIKECITVVVVMGMRLVVKALNSFKLIGGAKTNVCSTTLFFLG